MIDGCTPIQTYFKIVFPVMKPTAISVAILEAMWVWNDYLLPYLVLDIKKYKTIPIAIQYLKGGYGAIDMGAMMAMIILAIIPIIVFYIACQKYIIEGVVAGAVKDKILILWRKGDSYEKKWRINAGIQLTVKIWNRRLF